MYRGLPDAWAERWGVSSPSTDGDGDGLNNLAEYQAGTIPTSANTDGDGANDGSDFAPLDPGIF